MSASGCLNATIYISGSGSQVALGSHSQESLRLLPFTAFRCPTVAPADQDVLQPLTLQKISDLPKCLAGPHEAYGFYTLDDSDPSDDNERFLTFEKGLISVYSVLHNWKRCFTLDLTGGLTREVKFCKDVQGGLFCTRDMEYGVLSIYELSSGMRISSFDVGHTGEMM
ncbi:hypothetical protein BGZ80_005501, partial [Entomortierella chlamydospora]